MIFRLFPGAAAFAGAFAAIALAASAAPEAVLAAPSDALPHQADPKPKDDGPHWREARKHETKPQESKKSDAKADAKAQDSKKAGKPLQVGNYGDWGAYLAQTGKDKTCYALASPKDRTPGGLKRDPAYVFISNRPGENVRNEVSIIMGFALKEAGEARAEIGGSNFDLVGKGTNAWIKNPAEESKFVEALKKGSKLVVKAPSLKGNVTTDTYSLSGISQALERVQKDCP